MAPSVLSQPHRKLEEEEIDELPSDLDEYDEDSGFSIGDRLNVPQADMYTTKELHALIHEGYIDLNPPYQRDVVWTQAKQTQLIDSIYRNFYVPPIVFAIVEEEGQEIMRCVDGKQRLTSIQKFFDGQIPYRDPNTRKTYWWTFPENYKGLRNRVPESWKQDFERKKVTVVAYHELSEELEREVFQRVQMGISLNPAEKLQAISSPRAEWVSLLYHKHIDDDNALKKYIDVDIKRGRGFQSVAQLIYCCDGIPQQLSPITKNLDEWLRNGDAPNEKFKSLIDDVLTAFKYMASDDKYNMAFKQIPSRVAPLEFIFIGVALFVLKNFSYKERALTIFNLRRHVRGKYNDVRNRGDIVKYTWEFIAKLVEEKDTGIHLNPATNGASKKGKKKRARAEAEEEDDDDEERGASSSKGKTKAPRRKVGK